MLDMELKNVIFALLGFRFLLVSSFLDVPIPLSENKKAYYGLVYMGG